MIRKSKLLLDYFRLKVILSNKSPGKRVIVIDIMRDSSYYISMPILEKYIIRHPKDLIIFADHHNTKEYFDTHFPHLKDSVYHISADVFWAVDIDGIDLYLSNHQISPRIPGAYSIQLFHGQPSKGLSIFPGLHDFDALFMFGKLQEELFTKYFWMNPELYTPRMFRIGYPKTDQLFSGELSRETILISMGLDPKKKTVLYAPAFNQGASLQECGMEIIDLLASLPEYNIIVKFPPDIWEPISDLHATGGINWFEKIRPLELKYKNNLRIYKDHDNNPLLASADALITCVSGIAFDFLALNKPVIYIDTPKYFEMYQRNPVFDMDPVELANYTLANSGREFGIVVEDIRDLPVTIEYVLVRPKSFPRQQERLKECLLYNRGTSAGIAVQQIEAILYLGLKSRRPYTRKGGIVENIYKYLIGEKRHVYYGLGAGLLLLDLVNGVEYVGCLL